jgi:hypothetical protein
VNLLKTLDEEIEELEWKYAELALKPEWLEYIRNEVKVKQRLEIFKGMGDRVKQKMEVLNEQRNGIQNNKKPSRQE